jgi:hypothetical protein
MLFDGHLFVQASSIRQCSLATTQEPLLFILKSNVGHTNIEQMTQQQLLKQAEDGT